MVRYLTGSEQEFETVAYKKGCTNIRAVALNLLDASNVKYIG